MKPEFFTDEALFDAEQQDGLPLRVAYEGLWCCADREGRFEWRPRALKAHILPYDELDFSRVLHALWTRGWLVKYASPDGRELGLVRNFTRHQVINNREAASDLPAPTDASVIPCPDVSSTRGARVTDARGTREARGLSGREGKGTEGKGTEGSGSDALHAALERRLTPEGGTALASLSRLSPNSLGFLSEVRMILDGGRGGTPSDSQAMSLALVDMVTNGDPPKADLLRAYVKRAADRLKAGATAESNTWEAVLAKAKQEDERAAR